MDNFKTFSPKKIINSELAKLNPKENQVVISRFGLKKDPTTLAQIGRDLKLSRERVRQIEKEALKKLSTHIANDYDDIIQKILALFQKRGGLILKEEVAVHILSGKIKKEQPEIRAFNLFIHLLPQIELIEKHIDLYDSWVLADINKKDMMKILKNWSEHLSKIKKPERVEVLIKRQPDKEKYKVSFLLSLPKVSRQIIQTYSSELALADWSEFNPKTIRDKIYYVLKKNQSPMHFSEIARGIAQEEFDRKKIVAATVHNELISDPRFVLVGRGIYALTKWGYKKGTVKEIIMSVLKSANGALDLADIYKEVLSQRMVRKNTILINLQTQKEFKKVGQNKFMLAQRQK